jgi:hypothetical protein
MPSIASIHINAVEMKYILAPQNFLGKLPFRYTKLDRDALWKKESARIGAVCELLALKHYTLLPFT